MIASLKVEQDLIRLQCDYCIVGAGPAGITLAIELSKSGSVVLLEAGGTAASAASQAVYAGEVSGSIIDSSYLESSRLRVLGGSSQHWAGWCRPFRALDFSQRSWLEFSGWPINAKELEPYYRNACRYVEIEDFLDSDSIEDREPFAHSSNFSHADFHISPPTRFGQRYHEVLKSEENLHVFTDASLQDVQLSDDGKTVLAVQAGSGDGGNCKIQADSFVLACGGIENPRLLLNLFSNAPLSANSWLGAGFCDHAEYTVGIAIAPSSAISSAASTIGRHRFATHDSLRMYFPDAQLLQEQSLVNFALQLTPLPLERCPHDVQEYASIRSELLDEEVELIHMRLRPEPRISKANAITLSEQKDRFGLQRTKLQWTISGREIEDVEHATRLVSAELVRQHNATTRKLFFSDSPFSHVQFASHHLCSTRMAERADLGVVDPNARVHGMSNLYLAGSSVFSTPGVANPTLTLVALSLRLAAYLKQVN